MPNKSRRTLKPKKDTAKKIKAQNTERMQQKAMKAEQMKDLEKIQELKTEIADIRDKGWHDPWYLRDKKDELYMLKYVYDIKYGELTSGRSAKNKRKGKKSNKGGTRKRRRTKSSKKRKNATLIYY